jgi:TIR domain
MADGVDPAVRSALVSLWKHAASTAKAHFVGTGVFIANATILTVAHAVKPGRPIWVRPVADAAQAYPIKGDPVCDATFDAALITLESMPPHATVLPLDPAERSFDATSSAYRLVGFFQGQEQAPWPVSVSSFEAQAMPPRYLTTPKHPVGYSGAPLVRKGRVWGLVHEHFADPNTGFGCAVAVHQLEQLLKPLLQQTAQPLAGRPARHVVPAPPGRTGTRRRSTQQLAALAAETQGGQAAPVLPAAGQPPSSSQIDMALDAAWHSAVRQPTPDAQAFWLAWRDDGAPQVDGVAGFRQLCTQPDGPLELMSSLHGVLLKKANMAMVRQLQPPMRHLVRTFALAIAERLLTDAANAAVDRAADGGLQVSIDDPLTCHLTAAAALDSGIQLAWPTAGDPFVANVRVDSPILGAGNDAAGMVVNAWAADLKVWTDNLLSGQQLLQQAMRPEHLSPGQVTHKPLLRMALKRVQRDLRLKPLIALAEPLGLPSTDPLALAAQLRNELGVDSFVHRRANPDSAARQRIAELEDIVRSYLLKILEMLDPPQAMTSAMPPGHQVFISYAHKDGKRWLDKLTLHLDSLPAGTVVPWSDTALATGDDWFEKIATGMAQARCSVLIVTPGFLASRFIQNEEVPALLQRRQDDGLLVLPILGSDCAWDLRPYLKRFQMLGADKPLDQLSKPRQNEKLAGLARQIFAAFQPQSS